MKSLNSNSIAYTNINDVKDILENNYIWKVSTEQDYTGSLTCLGIFKGRIIDIAFYLAPKVFYTLIFSPVKIVDINFKDISYIGETVPITLADINAIHLNDKERVELFKSCVADHPYTINYLTIQEGVESSPYYGAVTLRRTVTDSKFNEMKEKALSKLTEEEKEILGLK